MTLHQLIAYWSETTLDNISGQSEMELKPFLVKEAKYIYLIVWDENEEIYSWGTMSYSSNRIRKSSLLNPKLTGKYDRRVDYLMLKKLYPGFKVWLFKTEKNLELEDELKKKFDQRHCYKGLRGNNRVEITNNIYARFKLIESYVSQSDEDKRLFDDFFQTVYLAKRRHPHNSKRTFFYGDCLEPRFLHTIESPQFERAIERILDVRFY